MIKNICTDLETSKRLKELGFDDSKTQFVYWKGKPVFYDCLPFYEINKIADLISCYTLEEILKQFPKEDSCLNISYKEWIHGINYNDELNVFQQNDDNLATTAAKLWIRLKESEIV